MAPSLRGDLTNGNARLPADEAREMASGVADRRASETLISIAEGYGQIAPGVAAGSVIRTG
jgi:hypothetical protein